MFNIHLNKFKKEIFNIPESFRGLSLSISSSLTHFLHCHWLLVHVPIVHMNHSSSSLFVKVVSLQMFLFVAPTFQWLYFLPNLMRFIYDHCNTLLPHLPKQLVSRSKHATEATMIWFDLLSHIMEVEPTGTHHTC